MNMADSRLLQGQCPVPCKLCEEQPRIQWKCVECDLLICAKCKIKIHPKFKNAKEHNVIDIRSVGVHPEKDGATKDLTKFELTVMKEYTTSLPRVTLLSTYVDDDTLWISSGDEKKLISLVSENRALQKVMMKGDKLQVIASFNIVVYALAITPANDLLIATSEPRLKQIIGKTEKMIDSNYSVEPLLPIAVHVNRDHMVFVGAKDSSCAVVTVMNREGILQTVLECNKKKEPLFTHPRRITTTISGTIGVIDGRIADRRRRVVIIDQSKDVISYYNGLPDTITQPFKPKDISTTPKDNFIVSDSSHILHILNSSGQQLTYHNTESIGILCPYSLAFTVTGKFYIGCTRYGGSSDKGKLYKVNLCEG